VAGKGNQRPPSCGSSGAVHACFPSAGQQGREKAGPLKKTPGGGRSKDWHRCSWRGYDDNLTLSRSYLKYHSLLFSTLGGQLSFLLDPPALLVIGLLFGKGYYLLTVFGDRVFRRGAMRRNLILVGVGVVFLFWIYSALLYLNVIYFPWPFPIWYGGNVWMLNSGLPLGLTRSGTTDLIAVIVFATYPFWFYAGTELGIAGHRLTAAQRSRERRRIIEDLAAVMFTRGGAIPPGAVDVGAAASTEALLGRIPPVFQDALAILLFVIDSRFFVFAFTGRWKRFVDLDAWEKDRYIAVWESNALSLAAAQFLRIILGYSYYTNERVYHLIGYNGPMVPEVPSWFTRSDATAGTAATVAVVTMPNQAPTGAPVLRREDHA
jgi:hypothetical protein